MIKAVLAGAAGLLFGGCGSMQCGDARVTRSRAYVPWELVMSGNLVNFPPISLSRAGTTELTVAHLPAGSYDYSFYVTGALPHASPEVRNGTRPYMENTLISICAVTPDGNTLLQQDLRLRDILQRETGGSTRYDSTDSTLNFHGISATDYRLLVKVREASEIPGEEMHIVAFAPDRSVRSPSVR